VNITAINVSIECEGEAHILGIADVFILVGHDDEIAIRVLCCPRCKEQHTVYVGKSSCIELPGTSA
jgi:hypothetical protein